ncbi:hypothetical protein J2Y03_004777 [Neobacillus niacini]|nr:hypothetical protein [Neobacillus niacini]
MKITNPIFSIIYESLWAFEISFIAGILTGVSGQQPGAQT